VAKQAVCVPILGVELDCFAEFRDCGLRKVRDRIGAAEKHVQRGGIPYVRLQTLEPFLAVFDTLGLEIRDAEKIRGFEIVIQVERDLQFANRGIEVAEMEVDAAKYVERASVPWVGSDHRLGQLTCFACFAGAEKGNGGIACDVRMIGRKLQRLL